MGSAVDLDMAERLVEVEVPGDQGEGTKRAYVPCKQYLWLVSGIMLTAQTIDWSSRWEAHRMIMVSKVWSTVSNSRLFQMLKLSGEES